MAPSTSYILLQHPIAPPKLSVKARYQLCDSSAKGFHKPRQAPAAMPKALFSSTLCGHAMNVRLLRQEQIRFVWWSYFWWSLLKWQTALRRKSTIIHCSCVNIPKSLAKQIYTFKHTSNTSMNAASGYHLVASSEFISDSNLRQLRIPSCFLVTLPSWFLRSKTPKATPKTKS